MGTAVLSSDKYNREAVIAMFYHE